MKDIALAKRNEYQKLDEEFKALQTQQQPRIDAIDEELKTMEETIKKQEADFLNYLNTGFLTRIEAMNNLLKENGALQFRYYLILIILMLIELMPVIAKTLLPVGVYDEKVKQREALEKQMAEESVDYEREMKRLYNKLSMQQDTETMEEFFRMQKEEQKAKLSHFGKDWKRNDENVQGFWEKIKQQMIGKPEN
jgi:anion-transporting  ArsA/GET3 family ATPase